MALLLAAGGAALAGAALRAGPRLACLAAAALAAAFGLHLLLYRVAAREDGLSERGLLGSRTLDWKDVSRVESGSRFVVVSARDERQVRIDTASFPPEDRARLDRTIAHRVRVTAGR